MEYAIRHQTVYRYPATVHESFTVCRLQPLSDVSQYCTRYELQTVPVARVTSYVDRYGNTVQHFGVLPEHDTLTITARSSVAVVRDDGRPPGRATRADLEAVPQLGRLYDFLSESQYVGFGSALQALANEIGPPADDLCDWYAAAGRAIHRGFTYDRSATSVRTTVDESIRLRSGVCQDYAHVLVALCRLHGIPARYVSGYVFSGQESGILGAEASHAWCEAYLPPLGWVGYDPTNDKFVGAEFVKIAVGRDYRDVSPVYGVYKSGITGLGGELSVNVAMEPLAAH